MTSSGTMPGEFAVVLRATGDRLAAKRLRARAGAVEVVATDKVRDWRWSVVGLGGLGDLVALLRKLAPDPAACVVGERVRSGAGPVIRRVLEADGAELLRRDRRWFAFDCDGWLPPGWSADRVPSEAELRAGLLALRATLPGLEDVECAYRLSSSFGLEKRSDGLRVPGYGQGLRCHLWFWFDRPVWPASVKRWLRDVGPVWDASMLDGAREHYTADPVLDGVADPAGVRRVGVLEGRPAVAPREWTDEATERAREAREAAELAAARAAAVRDWQAARAAGDVPHVVRMLRAGVVRMVDERGGASPDGKTAYSCALRALASARGAEWEGDRGAEDWAVGLLLGAGYDARTVKRAWASVEDPFVHRTVEGARRAVVPLTRSDAGGSRSGPVLESRRALAEPVEVRALEMVAAPSLVDEAAGEFEGVGWVSGVGEGPWLVVPEPRAGAWVPGRVGERVQAEWHRAAVAVVRPVLSDGAGDDEWSVFDVGRELAELVGAVGADKGEPAGDALEALRSMPERVLQAAGVLDEAGAVWEPLRSGRALWPVAYPGPAAVPVGLVCLDPQGARPWVGLRWPVARCGYQVGRDPIDPAARALVIVPEAADALSFDVAALGGGPAQPVLDVVAIGDEWRDQWSAWFSGREAVLLAWSPSARKWRAGDIAARAAARCDVPAVWSDEWPDDGTSSWRQREPAKVLAWWRRKLGEVASDGRHSTK